MNTEKIKGDIDNILCRRTVYVKNNNNASTELVESYRIKLSLFLKKRLWMNYLKNVVGSKITVLFTSV